MLNSNTDQQIAFNALQLWLDERQNPTQHGPGVTLRSRPPFTKTSKHDARGDAMNNIFESLTTSRDFPIWAAYMLTRDFIDRYGDKFGAIYVDFNEDEYEEIFHAATFIQKVNSYFEEYANEILNTSIDFPKAWERYPISQFSLKNRKPKMEDRHVILNSFQIFESNNDVISIDQDEAFFGVFDGHNGFECSMYIAAHILELLQIERLNKTNPEQMLKNVLEKLDKRLHARATKDNWNSGSTAACVYLTGNKLHTAWVGDSTVALVKPDGIHKITKPHVPTDQVKKYFCKTINRTK